MAKIRYFLSDDKAREAIAWRGQQRYLKDHALSARALWLKDILIEELAAQG